MCARNSTRSSCWPAVVLWLWLAGSARAVKRIAWAICVSAPLLTAPGCCWTFATQPSLTPAQEMPTPPQLPSLKRHVLEGTPGVWMDSADAGRLALYLKGVTP